MPFKYEYSPDNAEAYRELGIKGTSYEMAFAEAKRIFGNDVVGKTVLDFGSGTGRSALFLKKELGAGRVIGVDHDERMVAQAQHIEEEDIEFHLMTATIPLADNSVDGVLSTSVFIETKTREDMEQSFCEIARVMKPGSIMVITTANPEAFGHDFKDYSRTGNSEDLQSGDVTKCTVKIKGKEPIIIEDVYWTEEDYRHALETTGFTVEEVTFPKADIGGDWLDETVVAPEMVIKARKKSPSPHRDTSLDSF